jgi:YesN/AraC family two-component response regulator
MPGDLTLNEAASKVHLNASYVSQLFKQKMNQNFIDYITERRMKEAAHLLKITSLRVSEVAERLGYKDLAYFSNSFKKWSGETPSQYRNKK